MRIGALALIALSSCSSTLTAIGDAATDQATPDAALDTSRDGALDASRDGALDASRDGALDASRDGELDASRDGAFDGFSDAALDRAPDAPFDVAPRDVRPRDCDFATTYTFGLHGGLAFFEYDARLAPGRSCTIIRTRDGRPALDGGAVTCSTTLDRCGESDARAAELSDVLDALDHPDVVAAFAQPPMVRYGADPTVHDAHLFGIERADGRGFYVGDPCGGAPECREIPPGLTRLRTVLYGVMWTQGMRPECAGVGPF